MQNKKRLDFELLRMISVFFVIFNHSGSRGYMLFSNYNPHTLRFWLYLAVSIFCKLSVPVFLMITGALMLNRETESFPRHWIHRVFHMCFILLFWSFFYYLIQVQKGAQPFSISLFLTRLYSVDWNYSFWFLYMYIILMISLPLLQRFAKSLTDREYLYLFAIYALFNMVIPSVELLAFQGNYTLTGSMRLGWLSGEIIIFPLTGYFLEHRAKNYWNGKRLGLLWSINLFAILFTCFLTYYRARITDVYDEWDHKTFVLLNAATVFVSVSYLGSHTDLLEKLRKPILSVGSCAFGIYLIHLSLLWLTPLSSGLWNILDRFLSPLPLLSVFLFCSCIMLIGYLIVFFMKKMPLINRLVS